MWSMLLLSVEGILSMALGSWKERTICGPSAHFAEMEMLAAVMPSVSFRSPRLLNRGAPIEMPLLPLR